MIRSKQGKIEYENINSSFNKASYISGFYIENFQPESFVKFSNFYNLTENNYQYLSYFGYGQTCSINFSNYIKNGKTPTLIWGSATNLFVGCCSLFDNTCDTMFQGSNAYSITVSQCYFDNATTKYGSITFVSNVTEKFTVSFTENSFFSCKYINKKHGQTKEINYNRVDSYCLFFHSFINVTIRDDYKH